MVERTPGQIAYDAWREWLVSKDDEDQPIPKWGDLSRRVQLAWEAGAETVQFQMAYRIISGTGAYIVKEQK